MPHHSRSTTALGTTLVECLVAITLLAIAGSTVLATLLTAERLGQRAAAGSATDRLRWETARAAAAAPACRHATTPQAVPLTFPATAQRAPLTTTIRCGP